jgi:CarboxypepD_reg-like domain
MGGGLVATPLYIMKIIFKYFVFILIIFLYSCSSSNQVIYMDCLPSFVDSVKISLISYSYNPSTKSALLIGKVLDNSTNDPLIGANVTLIPCNRETATDVDGVYNFEFNVSDCDSIKINYIGYFEKTVSIQKLIAESK